MLFRNRYVGKFMSTDCDSEQMRLKMSSGSLSIAIVSHICSADETDHKFKVSAVSNAGVAVDLTLNVADVSDEITGAVAGAD
jgi:hypothetical protein